MGLSITEIAQKLKDSTKRVQLIYAFNGTGKTRLSREFRLLVDPKDSENEEEPSVKILYYNAFTEDLFYWDNDLNGDVERKLKIQRNDFTPWVLLEEGQGPNAIANFQRYTSDKLTPRFNAAYTYTNEENKQVNVPAYSEVTFSIAGGNEKTIDHIKVSKGEESCFIWSIFYCFIEQVVEVLNVAEPSERPTDQFDTLQYVFIDDPVSSLDDSHLIELAVDIANLIKSSKSEVKFIITTHNPLFYNVLYNEFSRVKNTIQGRLEKFNDGSFDLVPQLKDSPFSYHIFLLSELEKAIDSGGIQKYHFNFLRNLLEKTSTFLGFNNWEELLPADARQAYYKRILNLSSHSKHHGEEDAILEENDKRVMEFLVREIIIKTYRFKSMKPQTTEANDTV